MRKQLFNGLLLILFFAGCNSIPAPVTTRSAPTPIHTSTPTQSIVTETPTSTPDVEATDYWITSTAIVDAVLSAGQPRLYKSLPSPDGKWRTEIIIYDCIRVDPQPNAAENAYEQLRLLHTGGEEKLIDSQLQNCGGLGAAGLEGLYWSSNSRYFYYTDAREGVPDGCGYWEKPILRLNVDTLQTEHLGSGPLSPDGTKIVTWQGDELVIRDVNDGIELGRLSPHTLNTETGKGHVTWSPNSQAFVYVLPESYCSLSGKSYVVHVDLSTLDQTVLLESDTPTFGEAKWDVLNELSLFDENGKQWTYSFESEELSPPP